MFSETNTTGVSGKSMQHRSCPNAVSWCVGPDLPGYICNACLTTWTSTTLVTTSATEYGDYGMDEEAHGEDCLRRSAEAHEVAMGRAVAPDRTSAGKAGE